MRTQAAGHLSIVSTAQLPVIHGIIRRRILANYRIDPAVLQPILPAPFRPKLANGFAMGGICLIRLEAIRPRLLPAGIGIASENAAHRIAVVWEHDGRLREGVFVLRRDTSSLLNTLAGGRVFPGRHCHATFTTAQSDSAVSVELESDDKQTRVAVAGTPAGELPPTSVFRSLDEASAFFASGSLGYSVTPDPHRFDGLELACEHWTVEPLAVERIESSYFDNRALFPRDTIAFDCALLMRDIPHRWHSRGQLHVC